MAKKPSNPNFMNGVPELLILKQLSAQEMYGYELIKAIKQTTDDVISLGEGVVYPVLHALEKQGYLSSRSQTTEGRVRRYYRITTKGRRRLGEVSDDWQTISRAVARSLGGPSHVKI